MAPVMANEPFFRRQDGRFQPTPACRGPWNPKSLHGRVIVGLLGHVIEQEHGEADLLPARLTVDMFRLPDFSEIEVTTRVVRAGGRLKLVEADFISGGTPMARASCQFLRRTANPEGNVWSPPNWDAPAPADIPPPEDAREGMGGMWAMRRITGGFGTPGQRRTWMSEVRELVEGEALTPFTRVAVAADFASPFANAGDKGLGYINSDVTVYLHRLPKTPWVGFETINHHATDGVAIGECFLYDEEGPIGSAACAALAQSRRP